MHVSIGVGCQKAASAKDYKLTQCTALNCLERFGPAAELPDSALGLATNLMVLLIKRASSSQYNCKSSPDHQPVQRELTSDLLRFNSDFNNLCLKAFTPFIEIFSEQAS